MFLRNLSRSSQCVQPRLLYRPKAIPRRCNFSLAATRTIQMARSSFSRVSGKCNRCFRSSYTFSLVLRLIISRFQVQNKRSRCTEECCTTYKLCRCKHRRRSLVSSLELIVSLFLMKAEPNLLVIGKCGQTAYQNHQIHFQHQQQHSRKRKRACKTSDSPRQNMCQGSSSSLQTPSKAFSRRCSTMPSRTSKLINTLWLCTALISCRMGGDGAGFTVSYADQVPGQIAIFSGANAEQSSGKQ